MKARGAHEIRYPTSLSLKRWILDVVHMDTYSAIANTLSILLISVAGLRQWLIKLEMKHT